MRRQTSFQSEANGEDFRKEGARWVAARQSKVRNISDLPVDFAAEDRISEHSDGSSPKKIEEFHEMTTNKVNFYNHQNKFNQRSLC
jgi:hypothetical protein